MTTKTSDTLNLLAKRLLTYRWYALERCDHDEDSANDLVQDTYLKIHDNIHELEGKSERQVRSWIFTTMRNLVIDYRRSADFLKVERTDYYVRDERTQLVIPILKLTESTTYHVAENLLMREVNERYNKLPKSRFKEIVKLVIKGYSLSEIDKLNKSKKATPARRIIFENRTTFDYIFSPIRS